MNYSLIIPVRSGSQRVKKKNIRTFGNTTLLERKINIVKKVKGINEIIVSSDCDKMLKISNNMGTSIHKRDNYYSSSECPNNEYWKYLAQNVGKYENLIMVNCVAPFVDSNVIQKVISKYEELDDKYDGITTVSSMKKFVWFLDENNPANYDKNKSPNSQDLRELGEITFAVSICKRKTIIESESIFGNNPYFYKLDSIESFDIDNPHEFLLSEMLYKNNILSESDAKNYLSRKLDTKLNLLDCTIRDGGYINDWNFTDQEVLDCYKATTEAGYNYFEIGFKTNREMVPDKGKWCYCDEKDISNIKKKFQLGCKIAVMAKIGTFKLTDFVLKKNSDINMIRLLISSVYKENNVIKDGILEKNIIDCKKIALEMINMGYEVCINIPGAQSLNNKEIKIICKHYHDLNIECLYIADTFGTFDDVIVTKQISKIYRELNKYNSKLKIGFHSHNNNNDSVSKTLKAIDLGCNFIDSTINGLGRGAGNLPSELIILELNKKKNFHLKILPILKYIDNNIRSIKEYKKNKLIFGYHPLYSLSGFLNMHPNYITEIIEKYDFLKMDEIYNLIIKIYNYNNSNSKNKYNNKLIDDLIIKIHNDNNSNSKINIINKY